MKRLKILRFDYYTAFFDTRTNKRINKIPKGIYNSDKPILEGKSSISLREYEKAIKELK